MSGWNGSGVFNRVYSWVADAAAGIDITASRMDTDTDNITANGFGNTLTRDGQGSATANLPMNGFKHTGAGAGSASTDYALYGQITGGTVPGSFATLAIGGALGVAGLALFADGISVTSGGAAITGNLVISSGTFSAVSGGFSGTCIAANGTSGTQVVNISQFAITRANPMAQALPTGMMVQGGTATTSTGGVIAVTFPTAFLNAVVSVVATLAGSPGTDIYTMSVTAQSSTAASFLSQFNGAHTGAVQFNWMAIGY